MKKSFFFSRLADDTVAYGLFIHAGIKKRGD